ncbi:MAG: hypothetical protein J6B90_11795 [Lachnospiraceae bacterium]|nr:hypothetical protein [Lachnospiraceae bacterium]
MDRNKEKIICKKCLLMDVDEKAYSEKIGRILKLTEQSRKADNILYEKRLTVCRGCEKLSTMGTELGTCLACGCFVELRAAIKENRCPYKYW